MKVAIFGFLLALYLAFNEVKSDSPLQFVPEPLFPEHSHGHGPDGPLKFSTKAKLPTNVLPTHYNIRIRPILDVVPDAPDLVRWTAPGSVIITVTCEVPIAVITLHADAVVQIDESSIVVKHVTDEAEVFDVTLDRDAPGQLLHLNLNGELRLGESYTIEIAFIAPIAEPPVLNGLYRTSYTPPGGAISYLATTQFEAIAARQVFPCFDEPWMKATVKMTIGYMNEKYVALANEEAVGDPQPIVGSDGWVWQEFEETVKMSTYLIAITVADYKFAEANSTLYRKPVKTYGPPHLIERGGGIYSADAAAKILDFFENEYKLPEATEGIDYKLSKLDSVAVQDFSFGAMENWGLNIYRESALLYYPGESTEQNRNSISIILAHELAHQWFGNLVTCRFWDQIYLNEGFATYNEYIAINTLSPEFQSLKIQVQDAVQRAMVFDATPNTHPIINAATEDDDTDTIMAYFDRITYEKGGSVIRMMEGFLGKETFNRGLTEYLLAKSFQGAHQDDLFTVLNARAHADGKLPEDLTITDIMETWTLQSGFPIVSVSKANDSRIYISQSRFTSNVAYSSGHGLDPNDLWEIPVAIASADAPDFADHTPKLWLPKNIALRSYNIDATQWLVVNPEATGYFRVLYDQPLLQLILQQYATNMGVISPMSRSQIFDDYYTFGTSNYISIETALQFTKHLGKEDELVVWNTVFTHLRPVFNRLSGTAAFDEFRQFFGPKLVAALTLIGLEQLPSHNGANVLLRTQLLDWACAFDRPECLEYAGRLFDQWDALPEGDTSVVPVDIRQIIFCGAVSAGGSEAYDKVKARYVLDDTTTVYRLVYLNALGCAQDPALLARLQDEVLESGSFLKSREHRIVALQRLAANSHSRSSLIAYLRDNAEQLIGPASPIQSAGIASVVATLSTYVGTDAELDSVNAFIQENEEELAEIAPSLRTAVSAIEGNVAWRKAYENRLQTWFQVSKV